MNSKDLKKSFIDYFVKLGHKRIPNSSLLPENDASTLFINAGMQPIVRYLMGEKHPSGTRLVNYQRCLRTVDIDNVGYTKRHHTFFEMLGEWSLGDYWKEESLCWSLEFIINVLGLSPSRLYATVFKGNQKVKADEESLIILKKEFEKYNINPTIGDRFSIQNCPRIILLDENDNFWPKGRVVGPCGPCAEIYYDLGTGNSEDERFLEICNNVFMEFYQDEEGNFSILPQRNVDVGWGVERICCILQNLNSDGSVSEFASNFETDIFEKQKRFLLKEFKIDENTYFTDSEIRHDVRVCLDHIRASVMLVADGVVPSNKDQGYVLRRLVRRAYTFVWKRNNLDVLGILSELSNLFISDFARDEDYKELFEGRRERVVSIIINEVQKFDDLVKQGIKLIDKIKGNKISSDLAFKLQNTFGIPLEVTREISLERGKVVDEKDFEELVNKHKVVSRASNDKKFVGGLGDYSFESICYHTCAHLFLSAAKKVLGNYVCQKGQNITKERLRFDFDYVDEGPIPLDKLKQIEECVNDYINKDLVVDYVDVSYEKAKSYGVTGVFDKKYSQLNIVRVYRIYPSDIGIDSGDLLEKDRDKYVSLEFCGGPHVSRTSEISKLGKFRIIKQESVGKGVRRIKAILM